MHWDGITDNQNQDFFYANAWYQPSNSTRTVDHEQWFTITYICSVIIHALDKYQGDSI